jgi:hypothetical protein
LELLLATHFAGSTCAEGVTVSTTVGHTNVWIGRWCEGCDLWKSGVGH